MTKQTPIVVTGGLRVNYIAHGFLLLWYLFGPACACVQADVTGFSLSLKMRVPGTPLCGVKGSFKKI